MSNKGWISLDRSISNHWVWDCEYSTGQAWVDLILNACHQDNKLMIKGTLIKLKRGQQARSELTLSKQWKWSRGKVRRFLKNLEKDSMITIESGHLTSVITICNYSVFQGGGTTDGTTDGTSVSTSVDTTNEQLTDNRRYTNNNVNKDKKENNANNDKNEKKEIVFSGNQDAVIVLNYMNECLGTKYKSTTKSHIENISARLADHSIEDLKLVINHKIIDWGDDSRMVTYLRPQTLFQASKFEGYLMAAKAAPLIQESENQYSNVTRQNIENLKSWSEDFTNEK